MAFGPRQVRGAQARRPKVSFRAVLLGSFVLLVAVVAAGLWSVAQRQSQASAIPKEIGGYRLVRSVEGPAALQMVGGMHQGSPQIIEAWIAYYERGGVIWAGTTASMDAAREQMEAMAQAIGEGGSPFFDLRETSLAGRRLFTVRDSSSTHYFFQGGARVIWITPPWDSELPFMEAALGMF